MKLKKWFRQWSLSPTARITLGLVSLLVGLLLVLDLVLKLLPDQQVMTQRLHEKVAIHLGVQVKRMLAEPQTLPVLRPLLTDLVEQSQDIESIGLRQHDGRLLAATAKHESKWERPAMGLSTLTSVVVPLNTMRGRWGQLEVQFISSKPYSVAAWIKQPTVQMVVIMGTSCLLCFYLYLRRVLQHLDPSKAIPERVRVAFDTLTEGLLVLDTEGQILLANSAFRGFHPQSSAVLLGRSINQMEWLVQGLHIKDESELPWRRVLKMSEPLLGIPLDLTAPGREPRRALLNCAAIRDASGNPRGALVTLDDITALDRANAKLRSALSELEASRDQIQKQNDELQMLANCDPLTGCFNRRAFFARAEAMMAHAQATGEPLSCLMSDIDKFKNFNDTYGHAVGDMVIQQVSRLLKLNTRQQDVLCRYGGEEFCMLMPGYTMAQAMQLAEKVRAMIEREAGAAIDAVPNLLITSSFGVAQLGMGQASNLSQMIDWADQGLYAAKEAGRNRVRCLDLEELDAEAF